MPATYRKLLSEKNFLRVAQRARALNGTDLVGIYYKDRMLVFKTLSGTDRKTIWTQQVQLDNMTFDAVKSTRDVDKLIRSSTVHVSCDCLAAGTLIQTDRGLIPIEQIRAGTIPPEGTEPQGGDYVYASDGSKQMVVGLIPNTNPGTKYQLSFEGTDTTLKITANHTLEAWVADGEVIPGATYPYVSNVTQTELSYRTISQQALKEVTAEQLQVGDSVLLVHMSKADYPDADEDNIARLFGKTTTTPLRITSKEVITDNLTYYDISLLDDPHTYIANGISVHNCPAFLYWGYRFIAWKNDYGLYKETRVPYKRNPRQLGYTCKHLYRVMQVLPFLAPTISKKFKQATKPRPSQRTSQSEADEIDQEQEQQAELVSSERNPQVRRQQREARRNWREVEQIPNPPVEDSANRNKRNSRAIHSNRNGQPRRTEREVRQAARSKTRR